MTKDVKVATSNANEIINEANNASSNEPTNNTNMTEDAKVMTTSANESVNATPVASVEHFNNVAMQDESDCGCPPDEAGNIIKSAITVQAIIDGQEISIIPAFTDYSMEQPKNKEKFLEFADASKRLDVIFHFAKPEVFWKEGIPLFDRNGEMIPEGTPGVFPTCDTADSHGRVFLDKVLLNVQIHTFESVQEYAQTIGNTMLLSRGLNSIEKIGIAALATGDKAYNEAFKFAKSNNMPMSTALIYLDMQSKPSVTQIMMLGVKAKPVPTLGRTVEEAQALCDQNGFTFGEGEKGKRYAARAVSALLKNGYSFDVVIEALRTIPANDIANAKLMNCGEKEGCIAIVLTSWITDMLRNQPKIAA